MSLKHDTHPILEMVKNSIDAHLRAMGRTDKWLYERLGMKGPSYYGIWQRGSLRVDVLNDIAKAMGMTLLQVLTPPGQQSEPSANEPAAAYGRPAYIEERLAELEARVKELERTK